MYPFSAGPDGQFQIVPDASIVDVNGNPVVDTQLTYESGIPAVSIAPGSALYGNKQQMRINDLSGHAMLLTDESAGYGLSAPIFTVPMLRYTYGGGLFSVASGVESMAAQAATFFYNPCQNIGGLIYPMTTANGGTFSVANYTYRVTATDGVTTVASSPVTVSGAVFINRTVLLPSSFMNAQNISVNLLVNPTATVFFIVDVASYGASKAFYDANPATH
jgi:hypothetical protein